MTFRQFAFNNVTRNKRLYAAYFLSSMFMVMVFFTFAIFAFHPALNGGAVNGKATFGLNIASGIIYVFSFFFVLYSMSSFLQSRKKEFGLLMMLGMSTRQIRSMVFCENMLIGFFATLGGIGLGLVFAKGILLTAENVLIIGTELDFYMPLKAIILTFASFTILFLFISFVVSFVLRSGKLINLIKGDKKSKGEPKASVFLTITAIALLGIGYFTALIAKGSLVFMVMLPVIIVVIIGTYLLFTQLSVYVIRSLKNRESIFWRRTNMLLFADLSFRMKDNARTFFMVAIISTVAFSAIGSLYGFQSLTTGSTKSQNPYTLTYTADKDKSKDKEEKDIALIDEQLGSKQIETVKAQAILSYFRVNDQKTPTLIAKQSDYNRFASIIGAGKINLQDGQSAVVHTERFVNNRDDKQLKQPIKLQSGITIQPNIIISSRVFTEFSDYYVVNDGAYEQLPNSTEQRRFHVWQAKGSQQQAIIQAGEILTKQVGRHELFAVDFEVYDLNRTYGPVLFIGLFIGIVFFVSAGSFLYFRLYTDLDDDKQKFKAIAKMGLTENELKKVLNRQTAILFFAPIVVALVHGAVALTALSHMFNYNLFTESAIVLCVFAAIQVVYFFIVRFFYTRQIKAAI
ncbi:FtsX-like permease family protein [Paenibacillus sp. LMG 31460]|uniref:FtsX-like permease family protein n=1 Tax=Paenibacillus germinis TaxID=2654979 RepID=A0ABX1Z247_9BACL|nr:ABC transporter permease [Paenibacillus germinis]NOU87296.1 FtsX-like permease family protein [Paenibacillus germinis]